jgi:glucose-1-phosphate thymidylyltransferase
MAQTTSRALVLARGLGTRMQRADPGAVLTPAQLHAADAGFKALMPIAGRPFLDYVLGTLADVGVTRVGLVVAPDHHAVADHYAAVPPSRVVLSFVVQAEALGTANAVTAAEAWTRGEPFLAMNADNLYPVAALRALASLDEPGLPTFTAEDLVATSNIPDDRIRAFALVDVDEAGYLSRIVEKPGSGVPAGGERERPSAESGTVGSGSAGQMADGVSSAFRRNAQISMNLWRFDARIFDACRDVPRSARGEYELPEAVAHAIRHGVRFRAVPARGPVLDLSRRADAADVERRLAGVVPRP